MKKEKLYLLIAAGVIILLIFVTMMLGTFLGISEAGRAYLNDQMDTLKAVLLLLVGYYWGTSTSSANKTEAMIDSSKAQIKNEDKEIV